MLNRTICKLSSKNTNNRQIGGLDKKKVGVMPDSVSEITYDIRYELKHKLIDRIVGNMIKFDLVKGGNDIHKKSIDGIEESSESFDSSDSDIEFNDLESPNMKGGLIIIHSEQDNFS